MIKFKWWFPFHPFIAIFVWDPNAHAAREARWMHVIGALVLAGILLLIVQPWTVDEKAAP